MSERPSTFKTGPVPRGVSRQEVGEYGCTDAHRRPCVRDRIFVPCTKPGDRYAGYQGKEKYQSMAFTKVPISLADP